MQPIATTAQISEAIIVFIRASILAFPSMISRDASDAMRY